MKLNVFVCYNLSQVSIIVYSMELLNDSKEIEKALFLNHEKISEKKELGISNLF